MPARPALPIAQPHVPDLSSIVSLALSETFAGLTGPVGATALDGPATKRPTRLVALPGARSVLGVRSVLGLSPDSEQPRTPRATSVEMLPHVNALDGLRGVAITLVVLFHLGFSWMRGGFVGVDLFFVLSGYLITGILLSERERSGTIDLVRFWARRARRLLPALCLLLLVLVAVAALDPRLVSPAVVRTDGLATLFYFQNWNLALQSHAQQITQIFSPSPLLHTWSLAVEEQFYLLWPLLLLVAMRRNDEHRGRRRLWAVIAIGSVASGTAMAIMSLTGSAPLPIYYNTGTRAFELLIGAGLALAAPIAGSAARKHLTATHDHTATHDITMAQTFAVTTRPVPAITSPLQPGQTSMPVGVLSRQVHRSVRRIPAWIPEFVSICAVAGILAFAFTVSGIAAQWIFQGGLVAVALGAAALIWSIATRPTSVVGRILASAPAVAVGRLSYAIYLWHWPALILLTSHTTGMSGGTLQAAQVGLTLSAAVISRYLVEMPAHRLAPRLAVRRLVIPVSATALACALAGVLIARPPLL